MRRLVGRLYLAVIRRAMRKIDYSAATVAKVTDDIFTVVNEFWNPSVTNHVIGDVPDLPADVIHAASREVRA